MRKRKQIMALAAVATSAVAPAAAQADDAVRPPEAGAVVPNQLVLKTAGGLQSASVGGVARPQSVPYWQYACNQSWVTVQSEPNGWVLGNCAYGEAIQAVQYDSNVQFAGGWIGGQYGDCGWIGLSRLNFQTSGYTNNCGGAGQNTKNPADFAYASQIWTHRLPSGDADGVQSYPGGVIGNKNCQEYANFHPYSSGANPQNPTIMSGASNGPRMAMRYQGKYPDVNTGTYYSMVHDYNVAPGSGNWVFYQTNCLTNIPAPGVY
jgi:hypothetical protein